MSMGYKMIVNGVVIMCRLTGKGHHAIAMNRMKAADITQLHYLFDMYVFFIKIILLKHSVKDNYKHSAFAGHYSECLSVVSCISA